MSERRTGACHAPDQPLAQHAAQLAERRQLAQEQRGQRWSAAAPDLMRYRARLGGRAGYR
jgi:hypothetical protein